MLTTTRQRWVALGLAGAVVLAAAAVLLILLVSLWPDLSDPEASVHAAAVTGIATVLLAAVGIGSVAFAAAAVITSEGVIRAARETLDATRKLVVAADAEASAARDQAAAAVASLDEIRQDRELEFRPHVTVSVDLVSDNVLFTLTVTNVGRGPALDCALCAASFVGQHQWASQSLFDLGPGASRRFEQVRTSNGDQATRGLADDLAIPQDGFVVVVAYQDVLATRYRAVQGSRLHRTDRFRGDPMHGASVWSEQYDAIRNAPGTAF